MTPFYTDDWLTLYGGDCREVLASLPADSVDCVVTSPPYWGLRDYGTATWEGGDAECDHRPDAPSRAVRPSNGLTGGKSHVDAGTIRKGDCKCGATRIDSQLGLERTPEEYVANMVAVFREVKRVLKPSGTCWLNLGDSYAGYWGDKNAKAEGRRSSADTNGWTNGFHMNAKPGFHEAFDASGLKPKDLVGIPWRVAFALQADGWYLRSDIIWSKSNPMPESVTDRPTKSHEYLFLLTKQPRYYFDADAVREPHKWQDPAELAVNAQARQQKRLVERGAWRDQSEYTAAMAGDRPKGRNTTDHKSERAYRMSEGGRNIRSVWNIATVPYGNVKIGDAEGGHRDTLSPDCPVHSLRAIRRSLRTDGDDALLDHLRSRSPRNGSRPVPMPADGLFATLDLDSPDPDQSTPDSLPAGSSPEPMLGSAHASRTPAPPTSADGQESDAGTEYRTSHTPSPTIGQDAGGLSGPGAPSATGRSGRGSRTSAESARLDSASPEPSHHTPDTGAPHAADEQRQHTGGSSSAEDSARRDPDAQTDAGTSGKCTCPDYSASHFAVFPPELPERCIKAGSSERGVCAECGAPWERVVIAPQRGAFHDHAKDAEQGNSQNGSARKQAYLATLGERTTTGWRSSCAHTADPIPAVILDPFGGSGTVGMVANRLSRRAILIDLNPEYLTQQMKRNAQAPLGLGAA